MANESLYTNAYDAIMAEANAMNDLSQNIWSHPELNYEENHAHGVLCDFLEKRGFNVERSYTGVETAFKASWSNLKGSTSTSPHVVVICEYDALPEIGHACGHNLISQTGVAAGIGIKAAMQKHGEPLGTITVLGTPAEEGGGGKIKLIDNGALKDVDVALMVHPANSNITKPSVLANQGFLVTFTGRASHAAASPWDGLNALDAAVMAYNGLSVLRQQTRPSVRIHAVITKGGVKPNIIPDLTQMDVYVRGVTTREVKVVKEKLDACFQGAAITTGCKVDIKSCDVFYENMIHNAPLIDLYVKHMKAVDPEWCETEDSQFSGSTDMGNLSKVVPSIHPFYAIGNATNHSYEFTRVAGSQEAQAPTLAQGIAMARICLDVMSDPDLMKSVKEDFNNAERK